MTKELDDQVQEYLRANGISGAVLQCDVALALLRIGTSEALELAQSKLGVRITRCPPAVPPWPPKPIPQAPREPRVTKRVEGNPCVPSSDMHRRFARVRVGMTVQQVIDKGATRRDLRVWRERGYLEIA